MPPCLSGKQPSDPALGSGVLCKLVMLMFGFRLGWPWLDTPLASFENHCSQLGALPIAWPWGYQENLYPSIMVLHSGVGASLPWINKCLPSPWRAAAHCGEDAALEQRSKGWDGDRMLLGSGLLVPLLLKFSSRIGSSVGRAAWGGCEPDVGSRRMISYVGASSNVLKSWLGSDTPAGPCLIPLDYSRPRDREGLADYKSLGKQRLLDIFWERFPNTFLPICHGWIYDQPSRPLLLHYGIKLNRSTWDGDFKHHAHPQPRELRRNCKQA